MYLKLNSTHDTASHIGGPPIFTEQVGLPECRLCTSAQTFFLYLDFPENHPWFGNGLSIYHCVDCCFDDDHFIPKILETGPLPGISVPEDYLRDYQENFSFMLIPKGALRVQPSGHGRIMKQALVGTRSARSALVSFKTPRWEMEDESPSDYNGLPLLFLFDLAPHRYLRVDDAPPQVRWDPWECRPKPSLKAYYELFLSNHLYFFGLEEPSSDIYCIVQPPGG